MKKLFTLALALIAIISLTGCDFEEQVIEKADEAFDERLLGSWKMLSEKNGKDEKDTIMTVRKSTNQSAIAEIAKMEFRVSPGLLNVDGLLAGNVLKGEFEKFGEEEYKKINRHMVLGYTFRPNGELWIVRVALPKEHTMTTRSEFKAYAARTLSLKDDTAVAHVYKFVRN